MAAKPESALSLTSVRIIRFFMISIASWPAKAMGEGRMIVASTYSILWYQFLTGVAIVGGYIYIKKYINTLSFYMLGDVYLTLLLSFVTFLRSCLPWFKLHGITIKYFLMKFHLYNFQHKGGHYQTMYTTVEHFTHYYTLAMSGALVSGPILFNLPATYNNYRNGVYSGNLVENYSTQFSVNYIFPGYDPNDHFVLTSWINLWMSYGCSTFICSNDLLLSVMVFQIIGHIQVLKYNLEHFPMPVQKSTSTFQDCTIEVDMYNEQENILVHKLIRDCVEHHMLIVSFTGQMSTFFGPMLAFNYLYHLVSCSLLLLECSQGVCIITAWSMAYFTTLANKQNAHYMEPDALTRYGPVALITFAELIQISVIFEFVGSQSETLIDAVYYVPWEKMNVWNRRSLYILLSRIQTPITVSALGIASVGVQTMLGILKTTFSYFAFLQSLNE